MEIEMIQVTGLLSIMLIFFWLVITAFFIFVIEIEDKAGKRQSKYLYKEGKQKKIER